MIRAVGPARCKDACHCQGMAPSQRQGTCNDESTSPSSTTKHNQTGLRQSPIECSSLIEVPDEGANTWPGRLRLPRWNSWRGRHELLLQLLQLELLLRCLAQGARLLLHLWYRRR